MVSLQTMFGGRSGLLLVLLLCASATLADEFPPELVDFVPHEGNPVFAGSGQDTWDRQIRERGYILRQGDTYHLWYTGYNHNRPDTHYANTMSLGYATSPDGFHWTRHPENPIFDESWTEDMLVVEHGGTYYMFAEGRDDIAHMLTSEDRVHWHDHGSLDIRDTTGRPLSPGPYGTPTVWIEGGKWYLFYERRDRGIWLATSTDRKVWTNIQDDPVITMGPEAYDRHAVALNQIVKYGGRYYGYSNCKASMILSEKTWSGLGIRGSGLRKRELQRPESRTPSPEPRNPMFPGRLPFRRVLAFTL